MTAKRGLTGASASHNGPLVARHSHDGLPGGTTRFRPAPDMEPAQRIVKAASADVCVANDRGVTGA